MTKKTLCFILAACLLLAVPALAAGGTGLRTSEAGIAFIKDKEGFSAQAYEDSTGWAIGYGTRCQAGQYPDGITEAQADALLREHLAETEGYIDKAMSALGVTLSVPSPLSVTSTSTVYASSEYVTPPSVPAVSATR